MLLVVKVHMVDLALVVEEAVVVSPLFVPLIVVQSLLMLLVVLQTTVVVLVGLEHLESLLVNTPE